MFLLRSVTTTQNKRNKDNKMRLPVMPKSFKDALFKNLIPFKKYMT